ncbi:hypothetical protein O999_09730 [Pseudomonas putida LF54]|nr:hypothetical protein O999_09730 [Pseudomonas putida LF54]
MCLKTLQFNERLAVGAGSCLVEALEPAPIVYLYEQTTWTRPVILLRVWPFDITRKAAGMKRDEFLAQPEVEAFIEWLAANLPVLTFELRFKSSKFVHIRAVRRGRRGSALR